MHLTQLTIDAYIAGVRPASVERHIRLCCTCALRLSAAVAARTRWERRGVLRRLVRVDEPPTFDQEIDEILSAYRHAA